MKLKDGKCYADDGKERNLGRVSQWSILPHGLLEDMSLQEFMKELYSIILY